MTWDHARAWAGAIGWEIRNRSRPGAFHDDLREHRVDVWLDADGEVVRAVNAWEDVHGAPE